MKTLLTRNQKEKRGFSGNYCSYIKFFDVLLNLDNFFFLQFKDCLKNRQQPLLLLNPSQSEELHDDVLDILQVLDMFVSLLRPLVGPDLLLEDLGELLQPRVVSLRLGQEGGHVPNLPLYPSRPAGTGRPDLLRDVVSCRSESS